MDPSLNTLGAPGEINTSMDSVDLFSFPGGQSESSLGLIQEGGDEMQPMSIAAPPPDAFIEERSQSQNNPQAQNKVNICQIEFDVDHVGKNKPASKRMASWKYGMKRTSTTNDRIVIEEHEAQLIWSTHSGRWAVSVDGNEVYVGITKGSVLDYKWKWNHRTGCIVDENGIDDGEPIVTMRIVACRKPPIRASKGFRCYEFVVQGKPFRHLPTLTTWNEEMDVENEDDGQLTTILDIVEPTWRASGFV